MKRYIVAKDMSDIQHKLADTSIDCDRIYDEVRKYLKEHWGGLKINSPEMLVWLEEDGYCYLTYSDLCEALKNPEHIKGYQEEGASYLPWEIEDCFSPDEAIRVLKANNKKIPRWLLKEAGYIYNPDMNRD